MDIKYLYNFLCLIFCLFFMLSFMITSISDTLHEKWKRVGVLNSKYPKGREDKIRVIVTDKNNNVMECIYYRKEYRFSVEGVKAWKYYPQAFGSQKTLFGRIKMIHEESLAKKIKRENRKTKE